MVRSKLNVKNKTSKSRMRHPKCVSAICCFLFYYCQFTAINALCFLVRIANEKGDKSPHSELCTQKHDKNS